jgi:hypothetical protein
MEHGEHPGIERLHVCTSAIKVTAATYEQLDHLWQCCLQNKQLNIV